MQSSLFLLTGFLVSLNLTLVGAVIYLLRFHHKNSEIANNTLREIATAHNSLMDSMMLMDKKCQELSQSVYSIEERFKAKSGYAPIRPFQQ